MSDFARALDEIERAFRAGPELVQNVRRVVNSGQQVARVLEPAFRLYQDTHGGRRPKGRGVHRVHVPDASGGTLVEMGSITAIAYLTSKERGQSEPDLYIHDFERPYPTLAFRADSRELVIVRGSLDESRIRLSRYTVESEGIEG